MTDKTAALDQKVRAATESLSSVINQPAVVQPWSQELVLILGGSILVLCFLVLALGANLMHLTKSSGTTTLRLFGLTLILCLSAFLMIVGYGESQLTPIIGLFGAIAGYLLGKDSRDSVPERNVHPSQQAKSGEVEP